VHAFAVCRACADRLLPHRGCCRARSRIYRLRCGFSSHRVCVTCSSRTRFTLPCRLRVADLYRPVLDRLRAGAFGRCCRLTFCHTVCGGVYLDSATFYAAFAFRARSPLRCCCTTFADYRSAHYAYAVPLPRVHHAHCVCYHAHRTARCHTGSSFTPDSRALLPAAHTLRRSRCRAIAAARSAPTLRLDFAFAFTLPPRSLLDLDVTLPPHLRTTTFSLPLRSAFCAPPTTYRDRFATHTRDFIPVYVRYVTAFVYICATTRCVTMRLYVRHVCVTRSVAALISVTVATFCDFAVTRFAVRCAICALPRLLQCHCVVRPHTGFATALRLRSRFACGVLLHLYVCTLRFTARVHVTLRPVTAPSGPFALGTLYHVLPFRLFIYVAVAGATVVWVTLRCRTFTVLPLFDRCRWCRCRRLVFTAVVTRFVASFTRLRRFVPLLDHTTCRAFFATVSDRIVVHRSSVPGLPIPFTLDCIPVRSVSSARLRTVTRFMHVLDYVLAWITHRGFCVATHCLPAAWFRSWIHALDYVHVLDFRLRLVAVTFYVCAGYARLRAAHPTPAGYARVDATAPVTVPRLDYARLRAVPDFVAFRLLRLRLPIVPVSCRYLPLLRVTTRLRFCYRFLRLRWLPFTFPDPALLPAFTFATFRLPRCTFLRLRCYVYLRYRYHTTLPPLPDSSTGYSCLRSGAGLPTFLLYRGSATVHCSSGFCRCLHATHLPHRCRITSSRTLVATACRAALPACRTFWLFAIHHHMRSRFLRTFCHLSLPFRIATVTIVLDAGYAFRTAHDTALRSTFACVHRTRRVLAVDRLVLPHHSSAYADSSFAVLLRLLVTVPAVTYWVAVACTALVFAYRAVWIAFVYGSFCVWLPRITVAACRSTTRYAVYVYCADRCRTAAVVLVAAVCGFCRCAVWLYCGWVTLVLRSSRILLVCRITHVLRCVCHARVYGYACVAHVCVHVCRLPRRTFYADRFAYHRTAVTAQFLRCRAFCVPLLRLHICAGSLPLPLYGRLYWITFLPLRSRLRFCAFAVHVRVRCILLVMVYGLRCRLPRRFV